MKPAPPPETPSRQPPPGPVAQPPRQAASVSAEAALAAILSVLQAQRDAAPALSAGRQAVTGWLASVIDAALASAGIRVGDTSRDRLVGLAFDELFGLGPLEDPLRDHSVAAILVNGPRSVFFDRHGRLEPAPTTFRDAAQLDDVARRLVLRVGDTAVFEHELLLDRQLGDGTRVTVVGPPLAPSGPYLVIRRPAARAISLDSLVAEGALSPQMAVVLRLAVRSGVNILVCGMEGSGKAALLSALVGAAASEDRVVTLGSGSESWPELANHVRLTAGDGARIDPAQALAAALALRPDRLVVADVTEAMMPGLVASPAAEAGGLIASVLAATPQDALGRLEAALRGAGAPVAPLATRRRLAHAFQLVVSLTRAAGDVRRVTHVGDLAIVGEALVCRDLFSFDQRAGRFVASGVRPNFLPRLARAGLDDALLAAL
ncbi:MAG: CpaF family protein [Alphaproteobacteria bacterium]|nr:CpaF family protein [Alphaproteobacteria bacterium]